MRDLQEEGDRHRGPADRRAADRPVLASRLRATGDRRPLRVRHRPQAGDSASAVHDRGHMGDVASAIGRAGSVAFQSTGSIRRTMSPNATMPIAASIAAITKAGIKLPVRSTTTPVMRGAVIPAMFASDAAKRRFYLLQAFKHYAAAADRARTEDWPDWPDDLWRDWRVCGRWHRLRPRETPGSSTCVRTLSAWACTVRERKRPISPQLAWIWPPRPELVPHINQQVDAAGV